MAGVKRSRHTDSDIPAPRKDLDDVLCPICMEHPHNAVLLLCSSHDKGCRSYICDTSYRHSNCLDRFKKLRENSRISPPLSRTLPVTPYSSSTTSYTDLALSSDLNEVNENENINERNSVISIRLPEVAAENGIQDSTRHLEAHGEGVLEMFDSESLGNERDIRLEELGVEKLSDLSMKCPMCRGSVLSWEAVEEARNYLNLKKRSCSRETCSFVGSYQELRRHARRVHPTTRPTDVDPSRERAWQRLERQREVGDIVSAIRSAIPDAVVVGDYVIENGDRLAVERGSGTGEVNGSWWTTLFLFQMIGSGGEGVGEPRPRSRTWIRHRRTAAALPERRFLWGENLLGLQDDNDGDGDDFRMPSDRDEDASPIPRRRRRLTRSRSD